MTVGIRKNWIKRNFKERTIQKTYVNNEYEMK